MSETTSDTAKTIRNYTPNGSSHKVTNIQIARIKQAFIRKGLELVKTHASTAEQQVILFLAMRSLTLSTYQALVEGKHCDEKQARKKMRDWYDYVKACETKHLADLRK